MQTLTIRSRADADGLVHLDIPSDYANTELDVTVTVRPVPIASTQNGAGVNWPAAFFETIVGGWKGEPLVRQEGPLYELRDEL